jgi:hypothetical protein
LSLDGDVCVQFLRGLLERQKRWGLRCIVRLEHSINQLTSRFLVLA